MARRKFEDGGNDLPVGSHSPCQLVSIKRHEPTEELLAKFSDLKPSLCFRFVLYKPDDPELHKASAVRFCTDTTSKLGKLYEFVTDLLGGTEPEDFDEGDFIGQWFRVVVRKKPKNPDKVHVTTAEPIEAPTDVPEGWSESNTQDRETATAAVASDDDDEADEFPL